MGDETKERHAKQVIVMRRDLNMRKGKMVAQGAHASIGAWLLIADALNEFEQGVYDPGAEDRYSAEIYKAAGQWIHDTFTKICVSVNSEEELMQVYKAAILANLPVKLITDAGHTEFHGVPTRTCLAVGPAWSDDIDAITGGLTLL